VHQALGDLGQRLLLTTYSHHRSVSFVCFPVIAEPTSSTAIDKPKAKAAAPDAPATSSPIATMTQAIEKQWTTFTRNAFD
jgi:septal ring-binding cell division protein DamX